MHESTAMRTDKARGAHGRLGSGHLRVLRTIHAEFAAEFAASLSAMLRTPVQVGVTGVVQLTYGQFVFGLENPGCATVVNAPPLAGSLLFELNTSILFPIIDRMLGGGREACVVACRPLTEIELRLVAKINEQILAAWQRAWQNTAVLAPRAARVESNPQLAQVALTHDPVVLVGFEITVGRRQGSMTFCLPAASLVPVAGLLAGSESGPISARKKSHVELSVGLKTSRIVAGELADLRVGDLITTDHAVGEPLVLSLDGRPAFQAQPGATQGKKAVRITAAMD